MKDSEQSLAGECVAVAEMGAIIVYKCLLASA
jgi:hypothetical protein